MTTESWAAMIAATLLIGTGLATFICAVWYLDFKGSPLYARYLGFINVALFMGFSLGAVAGGRGLGALPALVQLAVVASFFCALIGFASLLLSLGERRYTYTDSGIVGDV